MRRSSCARMNPKGLSVDRCAFYILGCPPSLKSQVLGVDFVEKTHLIVSAILMAGLLKWGKSILQRAPSPPLRFLTTGFKVFAPSEILDKERFEEFKLGRYYLVNIGEVFDSKYQVIGKLGFGVTSTV